MDRRSAEEVRRIMEEARKSTDDMTEEDRALLAHMKKMCKGEPTDSARPPMPAPTFCRPFEKLVRNDACHKPFAVLAELDDRSIKYIRRPQDLAGFLPRTMFLLGDPNHLNDEWKAYLEVYSDFPEVRWVTVR